MARDEDEQIHCPRIYVMINLFCTNMARDEDEQQRLIREARMRKGKEASTASARRERVDQNPYVPKTRRRRDAGSGVESSQSHMDYVIPQFLT